MSEGEAAQGDARDGTKVLDRRVLEALVCPVTKGPLVYDREAGELISESAGLAYRIVEGVPIMLPSEARELDDNDL